MEKYDQLLEEIQTLSDKCKKKEPFNAFLSIGIKNQEVMHSKFIGMLLNPNGEHKQKDNFLKLFLEQLGINDFHLSKTVVDIEKIVPIEKHINDRRIDIAIVNSTQIIIIENKVWAIDQPHQMVDYYKFGLRAKNQVFMVYLTPYGNAPKIESLENGDIKLSKDDVKCISYEKDIIAWLKKCIKEVSDERLKLSLKMYEELIRIAINRDEYMTEIMNNLINSPSNMELAIDIVKSFQGKNFLEDPITRESFIEQVEKAAWNHCTVENEYDGDRNTSWFVLALEVEEIVKGYICFDGESIYAKRDIKEEKLFNEIRCNDLNDINLINLLTTNTDEVNKWMDQIIDYIGIYK